MGLVDELENSIDIVELVSKYTKLKKAWANYKAVCPFPGHTEKTPSFVVSSVKQLAYCFWCHKWWGALKFVMDIENMEFKEAIQILAWITWKKLEWFDTEKYKVQKNIYGLYKETVNYYKKALQNNPEAQKYLFERWLKKEDFEKFSFWFSDSWVALYNYLKEKWYDEGQITQSNIFVNLASRKDKFIGRIVFPIRNLRWDFVAFTARILNSWEPKYLNSPASDLYDKSEILYWLYEAKKSIVDKDFVLIVEWQMDAISCQSSWYTNTVAISWTALTEKHLTILKRLTHKLYLSFDWDSAWEKATKLALETIKNKWFEVKIVDIPKNSDPDDLLKSWKDFSEYIENAMTPIGYYIEKSNFDITSIEDRKKLLDALLEVLRHYSDPIEREYYFKEISRKLDIKDYIIYDKFNKINRKKIEFWVKKEDNKSNFFSIEELAIWYILDSEDNKKYLIENLIFKDNLWDDLVKVLNDSSIIEKFPLEKKDKLKAISMQISISEENDTENRKQEDLEIFVRKLNLSIYKKKIFELQEQIKSWNEDAFLEYTKIKKIAQENWISKNS
jgi:DNA primase